LKELVDLIGIEPMTSSMPWKRAPSCATGPRAAGMELSYCLRLSLIRQTLFEVPQSGFQTALGFGDSREKPVRG
jgi:hypothetical protein